MKIIRESTEIKDFCFFNHRLMASSSVFLHRPEVRRLAFASRTNQTAGKCGKGRVGFLNIGGTRRLPVVLSMKTTADSGEEAVKSVSPGNGISVMVKDDQSCEI